MKLIKLIIILLLLSNCNNSKKVSIKDHNNDVSITKENTINIPVKNYSDSIPKTVREKIVYMKIKLSNLMDPYELHLYNKIEFYFENKKIFEYQEKYLEIEGYQDKVCETFEIKENNKYSTFYVFKNNQRPNPEKYLIFKKINNKIKYIGKTENLTGEIFGDVDLDGKFEIGGYNEYCQAGSNIQFDNPMFCFENIRVYEIGNHIKRDLLFEKYIKSKIIEKSEKWNIKNELNSNIAEKNAN